MNKTFITFAIFVSAFAVVLAIDPGRFAFSYVDAGGHRMRLRVSGTGSPAVVFESGGPGGSGPPLESWERVQIPVARFTRTVAYDRAGSGFSAPGPKPRDARQVTIELHAALQHAGVPSPYILVGHSFGGPLIRVFAGMYPQDVVGLVLVDPTQEEFIDWLAAHHLETSEHFGEKWPEILATLDEARHSHLPSGIPVTLITAMGPRVLPSFITEKERTDSATFKPAWLKFHNEWLAKIPNAKHIVTKDSGHGVPFYQPDLVISAIRETVAQNRNSPISVHNSVLGPHIYPPR
jgi:pimeloyl-ACP methyl ester carboxylesterase